MKEAYEPMELDIRELPEEDVITVSGLYEIEHDNLYASSASFM